MDWSRAFNRSIDQQIALNRARTPDQRLAALCDLLDAARQMAPQDDAARERRCRVQAARQREREQWRERCRRILAAQRIGSAEGLIVTKLIAVRPQDEADIRDLLNAYRGTLDLAFVRAELETFAAPDDARWEKLERWVRDAEDSA